MTKDKFKIDTNLAVRYAYQTILKLIADSGATELEFWNDETDLNDPEGDDLIKCSWSDEDSKLAAAKTAAEELYEFDGRVYVKVGAITLAFLAQYPNYGFDDAPECLMDWIHPSDLTHPLNSWNPPENVTL